MNFLKKVIIFNTLLATCLFADVASGVELSEGEKLIFQNKKDIMKLKIKLGAIEENLDGIKSVLDSMGSKVSSSKGDKSLKKELDRLSIRVDKIESDNKKRFSAIESSINKILKIVSNKTTTVKKVKPIKKNKNKKIKILSTKQIYKNSLSFLKHKKYQDARDGFLDLVDKKYKLDDSYFYIAESLYYQKRYKEAIVFYKKSVNKNDRSKYLATLLLHSGINVLY